MRCRGLHRVLLIDEISDIAVHCSCMICSAAITLDMELIEKFYSEFRHVSSAWEKDDRYVLVLDKELK